MKHFYKILFLLLTTWSINAQTTVNFVSTGAMQTWTVPAGVTSINVVANGADGGNVFGFVFGGLGGRISTTVAVTSGNVLNIFVGRVGTSTAGGYNGGGNRGGGGNGTGGGGATDIRLNGTALSNRIVVAGGGGGAGANSNGSGTGGGGGETTAGNGGGGGIGSVVGGRGGTSSAGGVGGLGNGGDGGLGNGGDGGSSGGGGGGGGGGGYYGGGGGNGGSIGGVGAGGGGSSYTDLTRCSSVVHTQGANTGNGTLSITYTAALPIQLLSFTARANENQQVALAWKTALEQNAADFDLERSADAVYFEKIGVVKAAGRAASYTFSDEKPLKGFNYYRLKSNDTDTRFEYSSIVSVQVNGKSKVKIYPTLVHENLIVEGAVSFDIVNNLGQVVLQNASGDNTVNLQQLQNGTYFVRATDENGESFIQKIVKE